MERNKQPDRRFPLKTSCILDTIHRLSLKKKLEQHLKQNVLTCDEFMKQDHTSFNCIVATSQVDKGDYLDAVKRTHVA